MSHIYILASANARPITDKWISDEYQKYLATHPIRPFSFPKFVRYITELHGNQFYVTTQDEAYFLDEEKACRFARQNMADINEAGANPYLIVYSRPLDCMYPETEPTVTCRLFTFSKEHRVYEEITHMDNSLTKSLIHAVDITSPAPVDPDKTFHETK